MIHPPSLDNIRWLMIVLVVMVHAAVTYSNLGHGYYREPVELDPPHFRVLLDLSLPIS